MKFVLTIVSSLIVGLVLFFFGRMFPPSDQVIYLEYRQGGDRIIANAPDSIAGEMEIFIDGEAIPNASEKKIVLINETGKNIENVGIEFELPETFRGKLLSSSFLPPAGVADSVVEKKNETKFQIKSFTSSKSGSYSDLYEFSFVSDQPIGDDVQIRTDGSGIRIRKYDFQKNKWLENIYVAVGVGFVILFYCWIIWRSYTSGKENLKKRLDFISKHMHENLNLNIPLIEVSNELDAAHEEWNKKPENSVIRGLLRVFNVK